MLQRCLSDSLREQARSHIGFLVFTNVVSAEDPPVGAGLLANNLQPYTASAANAAFTAGR